MSGTSKATVLFLVLLAAACAGPQPPQSAVEAPAQLRRDAAEPAEVYDYR